MRSRPESVAGRLARLGFADPVRAEELLADPVLTEVVGQDGVPAGELLAALGAVADPDLALLALVRLLEAFTADPDASGEDGRDRLRRVLRDGDETRDRLLAVLGTSAALGEFLERHPRQWAVLLDPDPVAAEVLPATATGSGVDPVLRRPLVAARMRTELLRAVGADPHAPEPVAATDLAQGADALRVAYRRQLLAIAGRDLTAADPFAAMPEITADLSDLATAALEAGLAIARAELPDGAAPCRIAVIGLGKCGGHELNYVSDVDVVYVVEPPVAADAGAAAGDPGSPAAGAVTGAGAEAEASAATGDDAEAAALRTGTRLAACLAKVCSAATAEGTLWPVDAGLRPEGRSGPLVRTLASHVSYYERWAATWEFQALLKARPVAGDLALGRAYLDAIRPMVWRAAERENFVQDVQAMRRRVEEHVPARDAERQLKLGPGGLRDVEFSVQLLQLVHGRADPQLRRANTLEALEALSGSGYVGRDDAAEMDRAYRELRTLEHRIQLFRLRRTHLVPDSAPELRRIGRSFGFLSAPEKEITALWRDRSRAVRKLHEKLFYRPLLAAAAELTTDEVRLTPEAAHARLAALGYRDPEGAMRHLATLTAGLSRRASIQRQLLPVMLGWFADGADPDAGLLAFRRVSDELGATHWYLKMLRDSRAAAERMAYVLSCSRYVAELIEHAPETVAMLGDDAELVPRARAAVLASVTSAITRHDEPEALLWAVRALRRREIVRTAIADLAGLAGLDEVGRALSDAAVATIAGGLQAARHTVTRRHGGELPTRFAVVAMGRLGGGEQGYGSDADVLFVHDPLPGAEERQAQETAMAVFSELRRLLALQGPEPPLDVDPDLRPEGRNGPLTRTIDSYARYYERWSEPWEAQALVRAVPVAGDAELGERFVQLVDPLRRPAGGLSEADVREIRRIKARVESERLPKGVDPRRHVKLGPGALADVEWTVQLLQLRHAHEVPGLRTTSTVAALHAAVAADLVTPGDAAVMEAAWRLASRVRNAIFLWRGRASDQLPGTVRDLNGVARIVGHPPGSAARLEEEYRRVTRRARAVVERVFYG
ncbi:MAG: bifunctional [glutamine synthetase] adenylyltransferase/[glutamine synthetase]-adenylyl-L-tyrosine phosphorylase [Actinomycetales bacterium]|nr:bifunctional [glutamine synthetase] adenylyltransferase/[glutamine synthetase]-adenylyl-L-tyrosine phosphorylase [Actinomycetales bacterium]